MKRGLLFAGILAILACIVPLSSRRPDAVQSVIGLRGGVDTAAKAAGGILFAALAVMAIVLVLRKFGKKL